MINNTRDLRGYTNSFRPLGPSPGRRESPTWEESEGRYGLGSGPWVAGHQTPFRPTCDSSLSWDVGLPDGPRFHRVGPVRTWTEVSLLGLQAPRPVAAGLKGISTRRTLCPSPPETWTTRRDCRTSQMWEPSGFTGHDQRSASPLRSGRESWTDWTVTTVLPLVRDRRRGGGRSWTVSKRSSGSSPRGVLPSVT